MELATYPLSPRRDFWAWRLVATGASFVLFGLGGLLLRVLILPLLRCLPGTAPDRRHRARTAINRAFWLHVQFMYRTRALDFLIEGAERLGRPGQLVVANHPSLIDVVFLISQIRDANCVV
ncbi:MAG: 1-acyl-sn-glycerol-3-phosphate acyltransferase, partial [Xanthomonadaceae bacterium]|nr:1-acyl-sn-glycerol-3-phosphate acyltransferase [Xanthomonadaceae bacterium]